VTIVTATGLVLLPPDSTGRAGITILMMGDAAVELQGPESGLQEPNRRSLSTLATMRDQARECGPVGLAVPRRESWQWIRQ
jgi:hypothetical protein